jgi:hypothetical protein
MMMNRSLSQGIGLLLLTIATASAEPALLPYKPSRSSALTEPAMTNQVLVFDIDNDNKPDIIEHWWNNKRVRWMDENSDMRLTDTRGDMVSDVLQVDYDGDGLYDGVTDFNIRWLDRDGDGIPELQTFAHNAKTLTSSGGHWMIFIDNDKRGVLGWMDWTKFNFDCWGYSGTCNWLPNYHNGDFLKIHQPAHSLENPSLNWENPFSFFDLDGDGVSEMAQRWCAPNTKSNNVVSIKTVFNEAFVTFDLDNDSSKGNESDYDLTLRAVGTSTLTYDRWKHKIPELKGSTRFNDCFQFNNWRQIDELIFIPRAEQYDAFFNYGAKEMWLVFDEDDDDHRWERVEMMYPYLVADQKTPSDPWTLNKNRRYSSKEKSQIEKPGLANHPQADTLGDRGEFDRDNSGNGKLYIGGFDRKLHLYGAEWGAWTIDRLGAFHGGAVTPSPMPLATNLTELVRYTDTDNNGFIDTLEFDYDGDRTIDRTICLLDWKSEKNPHPDVSKILDTHKEGWKGLHTIFKEMAEQSWQEAMAFYRAAWRRGLTDANTDRLAFASSYGERYDHAYWLKETLLRTCVTHLAKAREQKPEASAALLALENDLFKAAYLGDWKTATTLIAQIPAR